MICTACQVLFGRSNQGGWDGWHMWESKEMCRGFWGGNLMEIDLTGGS